MSTIVEGESFLPRRGRSKEEANKFGHFISEEFKAGWPRLYALLSTSFVEGKYRPPTRLSVFAHDDRLKFCLADDHSGMVFFGTLDPARDVLTQVEQQLERHPDDWRTMREKPKGK